MSEKIRRSHFVYKLSIKFPSTKVFKALGFNKNARWTYGGPYSGCYKDSSCEKFTFKRSHASSVNPINGW